MRSLPPQDFDILPTLATPAGYICVIRDIDSDNFRIEGTNQPKTLVDTVLAESDRSFGIELVSILETEDLAASEAELYERYQARLSSDWLELDEYQLDELRRSILQIDAHASHYLRPGESTSPASRPTAFREQPGSSSAPARISQRRAAGRTPRARPLSSYQYGMRALRSRRRTRTRQGAQLTIRPPSWRQQIGHLFDDFWTNHPVEAVTVVLVTVFCCLVLLDKFYVSPYSNIRQDSETNTPSSCKLQNSGGQSESADYLVREKASVHSCASDNCIRLARVPKKTQIQALCSVQGALLEGSREWIEFRHNGETAFIHIGFLDPVQRK